MSWLLSSDRPRLVSIPPSAAFLDTLADGLTRAARVSGEADWLASALIYVPNNRSKRGLSQALFATNGRAGQMLPDIRVLGDLETDEAPPSAELALADLPPVIGTSERIGQLTRLVMAYFDGQGLSLPVTASLSSARELASLLDQAALSGDVSWSDLANDDLIPELAAHWQRSLDFLEIITQDWPAKLNEADALDPFTRRLKAAEAMAGAWAVAPPETPIIIAGSTGATPASRILMEAALQLPSGTVVLPGLDLMMSDDVWQALPNNPSHPQFTMARALRTFGKSPSDVDLWPGLELSPQAAARQSLIHEALAPARQTADWTTRLEELAPSGDKAQFIGQGLEGLTLLDADDETQEAEMAALILREALEHPGQTAALVTPDASLGRHVAQIMKRWGVEIAPSAGLPLLQTEAGSFAAVVLDWLLDPADPADFLCVLRHPLCRFEQDTIERLDLSCLRGVRTWTDFASLIAYVAERNRSPAPYLGVDKGDLGRCVDVLEDIGRALEGSILFDSEAISGEAFFQSAIGLMEALTIEHGPWIGEEGTTLARVFEDLTGLSEPLGPQPAQLWRDLFQYEAERQRCPVGVTHPRLAIWGPLEARLQSADHIILAGLNEGVWPAQPKADPFLARIFRKRIGLSDPDELVGLSAHDFAQLACARRVTLLCAARREDKPVVASRWIWRARMLARSGLEEDGAARAFAPPDRSDPRLWLKRLEQTDRIAPEKLSPEPRPPLKARPSRLAVTRVATLIRDPYAVYARDILKLYKLDPLNMAMDARARGTAIHLALEELETASSAPTADALLRGLEKALLEAGESPADQAGLRAIRRDVAQDYIDWRAQASHHIDGAALTEKKGAVTFDIGGQAFTLEARADRIETRVGGRVAILDFKSGKPPTLAQVQSGLEPQMPLQGLIARHGGFADLSAFCDVEALTYVQFGTKFDVIELSAKTGSGDDLVEALIDQAEAGLEQLLQSYADPNQPYFSAPYPHRRQTKFASDYDRLARRSEWEGQALYDEK